MSKIHMRGNWGSTLCGREGWNGHAWSSWEAADSLSSTMDKDKVTCGNCKKAIKTKRK